MLGCEDTGAVAACRRSAGGATPEPQRSSPNTATPVCAPTNTLPSAIMGVMNLMPAPKWVRLAPAWPDTRLAAVTRAAREALPGVESGTADVGRLPVPLGAESLSELG